MLKPLIAAFAAMCLVAPVAAQTTAVHVPVSSAGLDLATPHGMAALDRRIWRAAEKACGPVSSLDLVGSNVARRCATRAAAAARPQRDRLVAAVARVEVARP